jgi:hypothetical protein
VLFLLPVLAFESNEADAYQPGVLESVKKSLVVQLHVLREEDEQRFSDWERSGSGTVEIRAELLGVRQMQALNDPALSGLNRLFSTSLFVPNDGEAFIAENSAAIKTDIQQLERRYMDWAEEQTGSATDPRALALRQALYIPPLEELVSNRPLAALQAQVVYNQLYLAELMALDIFVQRQGVRTVYWPFEALLMDWQRPPSYVGVPITGRLLLGNFPPTPPPAKVDGKELPAVGDDFYYKQMATVLGEQDFEVEMWVRNPMTGAARSYRKTVPYTVVPQ